MVLIYLLGDIERANGLAGNQQSLYTSMDAVVGHWIHKSGVTGTGSWNFGTEKRDDQVVIYGDKGKIYFSVFNESPVILEKGETKKSISIQHPENIQFFHVDNMKKHLLNISSHPSTGTTAAETSWVLDAILNKKL